MHLSPSDPDIATVYRRISQGRLDLQPNFQRGEVWGKPKKQRLIDSILRGWHIPPIHVIQVPNSEKQEVLDGQQRLAAIRDFIDGKYAINGMQEPIVYEIEELDGLFWNELPTRIKGKIEDFTIRILTISDYMPGEPGELFYRLNQPTNLTSAEARNAYFGESRQQVKDLVEHMIDLGFSTEFVGFSNSRMAYDDVIAKCLMTLECKTLSEKITANQITARYRESTGFESEIVNGLKRSVSTLYKCIDSSAERIRLNKATLYSWLLFIFKAENKYYIKRRTIVEYFKNFEQIRVLSALGDIQEYLPKGMTSKFTESLVGIYVDRSSSRVADTMSVKLRDIALWGVFAVVQYGESNNSELKKLADSFYYLNTSKEYRYLEKELSEVISFIGWGEPLW